MNMENTDITKWNDTVIKSITNSIYKSKYKAGIINNFNDYVRNRLKDSVGEIDYSFIDDYFVKNTYDFSAQDCAHMALSRVGIPPIETMSVESLEKTIRDVFEKYNDKVYIKRSKKNAETLCVGWNTACAILEHSTVKELIQKQIGKAENKASKQCSKIAWRAYEFEKQKIALLEAMNLSENEEDGFSHAEPSDAEKTNLMVEALFNNLFTNVDFEKYKRDYDEMELLYDNWEFGERYQELYDIFNAPNYNWKYYTLNIDNPLIDALADKIAVRIVEIMENRK